MQASSLRTLPQSVGCASVQSQPEAFLAEVTLRFTSAKNRCGFRADRLRPPACPPLYPDTAPTSRCRARSPHLRLQTLFDGYVPAFAATPPMSGCWHAPLRCQPGNLRLLFRLTRTVILSPSSGRRTAAIRHHPPTHKWTDERTEISPWHSLISRRGQECRRLLFSSPPGTLLMQWHLTAHSLSRSLPKPSPTPSIFGRGSAALHFG